jgi:ADP-ribose pyrophosphatase
MPPALAWVYHPLMELYNGHGWRVTLETADVPGGKTKTQSRVHRCDSVHILAIPQPSTILLLREYRPLMGQWRWMLPAGKMDKPGESPLEAAQRELREETGFRSNDLRPFLNCYPSENIVQQNHIFVAQDLVRDPLAMEDYELIEVHELPLAEALERVFSQDPLHTLSGFALLAYARKQA